jgi:predicted lipid carrier protein YhbT
MKLPPLLAAPLTVIPLLVINRATRLMLFRVLKQHPGLFDRLGEHLGKRYGFVPTDLPLTFVVEPAKPMITVARKPGALQADAKVRSSYCWRCSKDAAMPTLFSSRATWLSPATWNR